MDNKQRKTTMEHGIEMYESLNVAVDKAGGSPFLISDLKTMTVLELFSTLAPNNVRFVCNKPEDKKEAT